MTAHDPEIYQEAFNLLCGDVLGRGIHRQVFECRIDRTLVVKVEYETAYHTGSNAAEWKNWNEHSEYEPIANWLAPCVWISPNARVMLQRRTEPMLRKDLPPKLPACFTDIKPENVGMLEGRLVFHDYPLLRSGLNARMRKVVSWE